MKGIDGIKGPLKIGFDFMLSSNGVHNISVLQGSFKLMNQCCFINSKPLIIVLLLHCI